MKKERQHRKKARANTNKAIHKNHEHEKNTHTQKSKANKKNKLIIHPSMVTKLLQYNSKVNIVMSQDQSSEEDLTLSLEERILEQQRRSLIDNSSGNSLLGQEFSQNRPSLSLQHAEVDRGNHHHHHHYHHHYHHQGMLESPPPNLQPMLHLSHESYLGAYDPLRNDPHVPLLNHHSLEERILDQRHRSLIDNSSGNSFLGQELSQNRPSLSLQHAEVDRDHHHHHHYHHQGMFESPPPNMQPMLHLSHESYLGAYDPFRNDPHVPLLNHQRLQTQTLPNSQINITGNVMIDARSHQNLPQYATRQVPQVYYDPLLIPVAYNPPTLLIPVAHNPLHASTTSIEHDRHVPHSLISTQQAVPNITTIESEIAPFRQNADASTLHSFGIDRAAIHSYRMEGQQVGSIEDRPITQYSTLENMHFNQTGNTIMADTEEQKTGSNESPRKKSRAPTKRTSLSKSFEDHFESLVEFKEKFGHCNVPHRYKENPSLGNWSNNIRTSWRIMKDGGIPSSYKLTRDQIRRLDKIGFRWKFYSDRQFRADREHKTK